MASGDEIQKPKLLVMAPTANSASIIGGKTIESCLGINPHVKWNYVKASQERQSNLKHLYSDVKILVLDEISMIGSNKFCKMNYQMQSLQEGADKIAFFGNKSIIAGGDLHQIPPISDRFIFEKSTIDGRPMCAPSHWLDNFRIFHLTEKMRSANDQQYGLICDRVGENTFTKEDELFFQSRIVETDLEMDNENFKNGKMSIIVTTNKYREKINNEKLEALLPHERTYVCNSLDSSKNVSHIAPVPKDLPYTQTASLPTSIKIKLGAPVAITANHKKKEWKEDGYMNGARGFIEFIQVSEDDPDEVTVIWMVFNRRELGAKYRAAPENYKLRGDLNLSEYATPILPTRKTFKTPKTGNIEFQRKQFPLTRSLQHNSPSLSRLHNGVCHC